MRYVIDVVVNFGRSWGGLWAAQICLIWAVGLVLSYIRYLILSYLILDILDIFVILGYLGHRQCGHPPRSGANRSPKGIPSKRASGTDFGPILINCSPILYDLWLIV